ncbi:MAG: DUF1801 domain-containing protein [Chloroflexota bacterium]|nr:DUF1801 domain-containing protein [Chloroflexota bacterium]
MGKLNRIPPEHLLIDLDDERRAVAEHLRALIKERVPQVEEVGYGGWRLTGYRNGGYFGFIAPLPDQIRLGFEHGIDLPDPTNILTGEGKQVRSVGLKTFIDLEQHDSAIRDLIDIAAARARQG